jgi:hypothetical protein
MHAPVAEHVALKHELAAGQLFPALTTISQVPVAEQSIAVQAVWAPHDAPGVGPNSQVPLASHTPAWHCCLPHELPTSGTSVHAPALQTAVEQSGSLP